LIGHLLEQIVHAALEVTIFGPPPDQLPFEAVRKSRREVNAATTSSSLTVIPRRWASTAGESFRSSMYWEKN
jgi:hypothetical protein